MSVSTSTHLETLFRVELFADLPHDIIRHLAGQCRWRQTTAGELVIDGACPTPHGVYVLAEGVVEIFRARPDAPDISITRLSAVDCFGEFAAIRGEPGSASVRSLTRCSFAVIPTPVFTTLLTERPPLSLRVLRKLISRIQYLDETVEELHLKDWSRTAEVRDVVRTLSLGTL